MPVLCLWLVLSCCSWTAVDSFGLSPHNSNKNDNDIGNSNAQKTRNRPAEVKLGSSDHYSSVNNHNDNHDATVSVGKTRRDVWSELLVGSVVTSLSLPISTCLAVESDNDNGQNQEPFLVSFQVQLAADGQEGNTGEIVVQVMPEWAPLAADRFQQLVEANFFDKSRVYRVLPGYIAQFGIAGDPELNKIWMFDKSKALPDEKRRAVGNKKGTLSFASSGKNSRKTQVFINLSNNDGPPNFLDAQGFVPFARVVQGMEDVVPKLYSGYGLLESASAGMAGTVNQGKAAYFGNEYLETLFPKLSVIRSAKFVATPTESS
jgi:cyclophilin family peptidyl-prolyl cis-trans isomerase